MENLSDEHALDVLLRAVAKYFKVIFIVLAVAANLKAILLTLGVATRSCGALDTRDTLLGALAGDATGEHSLSYRKVKSWLGEGVSCGKFGELRARRELVMSGESDTFIDPNKFAGSSHYDETVWDLCTEAYDEQWGQHEEDQSGNKWDRKGTEFALLLMWS